MATNQANIQDTTEVIWPYLLKKVVKVLVLWDYVRSLVYGNKSSTLKAATLKEAAVQVTTTEVIRRDLLENVVIKIHYSNEVI